MFSHTGYLLEQRGKIERYAREGKPTPYGQVVDRAGNVRTDTLGILEVCSPPPCLPSLSRMGGRFARAAEIWCCARARMPMHRLPHFRVRVSLNHADGQDLVMGNAALCPLGGAGEEMGGYKGYGWAAAVELLCTAFQQGPFGQQLAGVDRATGAKMPMPLGHVFLAIDVEALTSLDDFKRSAGAVLVSPQTAPVLPLLLVSVPQAP